MYDDIMEQKQRTSFRLSPEAMRILHALAQKYGLTLTSVLEMVLRDRARQEDLRP